MNPNNYLICKPVDDHKIEVESRVFTVLFDQYNSLGFKWKPNVFELLPHYFQEEDFINDFMKKLNNTFSDSYSTFLFDTSGSLAVEHAIHYSQLYTGKQGALKYSGCYHGSTLAIKKLDGDPLRLPHDIKDAVVGVPPFTYEQSLEEIEERLLTGEYACIIIDPNFCDYLINPPDYYWKKLRELSTHFDCLIILDEMRTGFRSPKIWYVNELSIQADMVVGCKALSSGLPFSLTGIHDSVYDELCYVKVNEYCTGFSYNPLIFKNVHSIFNVINSFYQKKADTINMLEDLAMQYNSDSLSITPRGCGLLMTVRTPRPVLVSALSEAKLKEKGILLYRSENKFILYPHFTFPCHKLRENLMVLINEIKQNIDLQLSARIFNNV